MHKQIRVALAIIATLLMGVNTANASKSKEPRERAMKTTENSQWTTHCVGRFLIDLPPDAEYVGGHFEYGFAKIERRAMDQSQFQKEVESFEKHLRETKHKSGTSLLLKRDALDENSRVFGYWDRDDQDVAIDLSGYRWINGQRYLGRSGADPDRLDGAAMRLRAILNNLQPMQTSAPTTKGFCIDHAMIADEGSSKNENLNMRFRLKNHPDIVVDLATNRNSGNPPESLLSRKPSVFSGLGLLGATLGGVQNIREGDRKIGDHPGQEWLLKAPNDKGQQAHLFTWEAPGLHRDPLHPQIRIDLQSGNTDGGLDPIPISMTDQQMLELWEKILKSLRLRPTDGGQDPTATKSLPVSDSGNALRLGELARTGASCPQTGYWQCPEPDVHGSTRLFRQGFTMPPAIVKRDLSFMERVRGANPEISTNTVWRLVRYAEPSNTLEPPTLLNNGAGPSSEA
jgi:hypothetical protein